MRQWEVCCEKNKLRGKLHMTAWLGTWYSWSGCTHLDRKCQNKDVGTGILTRGTCRLFQLLLHNGFTLELKNVGSFQQKESCPLLEQKTESNYYSHGQWMSQLKCNNMLFSTTTRIFFSFFFKSKTLLWQEFSTSFQISMADCLEMRKLKQVPAK